MIDEIMRRWTDLGKPLFMVPKDFKEKILQSMDAEIKFNYLVKFKNVEFTIKFIEMAHIRIGD